MVRFFNSDLLTLIFYRNNCVRYMQKSDKLLLILFNRKQVLPYAIQKLQAVGYQLVTLAECLEMPAYQSVVTPGTPDVSPLLAFFLLISWCLSDPRLPLHLPFAVKLALLGGDLDLERTFFQNKRTCFFTSAI
jgi:hypothetical protein